MKRIFLPADNTLEASVIPDIDVISLTCLSDLIGVLKGDVPIPARVTKAETQENEKRIYSPDFSDII